MSDNNDIREGPKVITAQRARDMVQICDVAEAAIRLAQVAQFDGTLRDHPAVRSLRNTIGGLPDRLIRELLGG